MIAHELTGLSGNFDLRNYEDTFAVTNRLRTEGTDHLLAAGRAVGVERFVAQSYAGWPFARTGAMVKSEDDPLDPTPAEPMRSTLEAIRYLEETVTGATWTEGIVLRYGGFYGPGTEFSLHPDGDMVELMRKRKFPVVGRGTGVWSFVHIEDAASATVAAIEHGERGIYNVVDDDPAPGQRVAARRRLRGRRAQADAPAALARPAGRRRGGRRHDERGARRVEREGEARARLEAALRELAPGLRGGARMSASSRSCGRGRSRSPTACSAA